MSRLLWITIPALGAGLALGFTLGTLGPPDLSTATLEERFTRTVGFPARAARVEALAALLEGTSPAGLEPILAGYRAAPINGGDVELVPLAAWWASFAPEDAFRWTQRDQRAKYRRVVEAVLRTWAASDPGSALEALAELRGSILREFAAVAIFVGADEAGTPLEEQRELLLALPSGRERQLAIDALARRALAANDVPATLRWAETLSSGRSGDLAVEIAAAAARAVAPRAPDVAADWLGRSAAAGGLALHGAPAELYSGVAEPWIAIDPEAAMAWLASLPAGADRDASVRQAFKSWRRRDDVALAAWIEPRAFAPELWLEPALDLWVRFLSADDPEQALIYALRLSRADLRERATRAIIRFWRSRDAAAADAWIDAASLSQEEKQVLRAQAPTDPRHLRLRDRAGPRGGKAASAREPGRDAGNRVAPGEGP